MERKNCVVSQRELVRNLGIIRDQYKGVAFRMAWVVTTYNGNRELCGKASGTVKVITSTGDLSRRFIYVSIRIVRLQLRNISGAP